MSSSRRCACITAQPHFSHALSQSPPMTQQWTTADLFRQTPLVVAPPPRHRPLHEPPTPEKTRKSTEPTPGLEPGTPSLRVTARLASVGASRRPERHSGGAQEASFPACVGWYLTQDLTHCTTSLGQPVSLLSRMRRLSGAGAAVACAR